MTVLRHIATVAALPGYRLAVGLDDGASFTVDLSAQVARGGVFSPLRNAAAFGRVRIGARHRTLEWPSPHGTDGEALVDIDAEALLALSAGQ
jgi:hypothetical protein